VWPTTDRKKDLSRDEEEEEGSEQIPSSRASVEERKE
jgi:hypothetical protein